MPDELTEPGRATPARASSFLIENLLAAEAKGTGRAAQGGGGREDEEDDDDDPEDEDAEQARRRRLQRRRQLRAGSGPGGEARARALLGPGALGLGPRPPPGPGPPYALGCGDATRWYSRAHGGYGGGLSPDSECGRGAGGRCGGARLPARVFARGLWVRRALSGPPSSRCSGVGSVRALQNP